MKALAQIFLEISCTQDFQILYSKGHNSEKGHNTDIKIQANDFFIRNMCMKFQNPSIHHLKVSNSPKIGKPYMKFEISNPQHAPFKS